MFAKRFIESFSSIALPSFLWLFFMVTGHFRGEGSWHITGAIAWAVVAGFYTTWKMSGLKLPSIDFDSMYRRASVTHDIESMFSYKVTFKLVSWINGLPDKIISWMSKP